MYSNLYINYVIFIFNILISFIFFFFKKKYLHLNIYYTYILYRNNTEKIIKSNYSYLNPNDKDNHNNYLKIKISNSYFYKNNGLFYSANGYYDFENCNY